MSNRDFLYNFYKERGLPDHVIAGILGNASAESNFDPAAFNNTGGGQGALGIFQWRGPRQAALREFAAANGLPPEDLNTQAEFSMIEFEGAENNAFQKVMATSNPNEAANAFRDHYERSGGLEGDAAGYQRGSVAASAAFRDYTDPNYVFAPELSFGDGSEYANAGTQLADQFSLAGPQQVDGRLLSQIAMDGFQAPDTQAVQDGMRNSLQALDGAVNQQAPTQMGVGTGHPNTLGQQLTDPVPPSTPTGTLGSAFSLGGNGGNNFPVPPSTPTGTSGSAFSLGGNGGNNFPVTPTTPAPSSGATPPSAAPTKPEGAISAKEEADPWNWKLGLFEGLEGLGVGLAQMSHGDTIDLGPMRTRIENTKLGVRAADTAQFNADTARQQENRLQQAAGAPFNRNAVASIAQANGASETELNAILTSDEVAKQALTGMFGKDTLESVDFYNTPKGRTAFAAMAGEALAPEQIAGMSPDVMAEWAKNNVSAAPSDDVSAGPAITIAGNPTEFANAQNGLRDDIEFYNNNGDVAARMAAERALRASSRPNANMTQILADMDASIGESSVLTAGVNAGSDIANVEAKSAADMALADHNAAIASGEATKLTDDEQAKDTAKAAQYFKGDPDFNKWVSLAGTIGYDAAKELYDAENETASFDKAVTSLVGDGNSDRAMVDAINSVGTPEATEQALTYAENVNTANYLRNIGADETAVQAAKIDGMQGLEMYETQKEAARIQEESGIALEAAQNLAEQVGDPTIAAMLVSGDADQIATAYGMIADAANSRSSGDVATLEYIAELPTQEARDQAYEVLRGLGAAKAGTLSTEEQTYRDSREAFINTTRDREEAMIKNDGIIARIQEVRQIMATNPSETGFINVKLLPLRRLAASVGLSGDWFGSKLTTDEYAAGVMGALTQQFRQSGSGTFTDKDAELVQGELYNAANTQTATDMLLQAAQYKLEVDQATTDADYEYWADPQNDVNDKAALRAFRESALAAKGLGGSAFENIVADGSSTAYISVLRDRLESGDMLNGTIVTLTNSNGVATGYLRVSPERLTALEKLINEAQGGN